MKKSSKLSLGLATIVAASLGLTAVSGSAMAASTVLPVGSGATITINGSDALNPLSGHKFKAVQVGGYADAETDGTDLTNVSVNTVPAIQSDAAAVLGEMAAAGENMGFTGGTAGVDPHYTGNAIGQVAEHWLGYTDASATNNVDTTSNGAHAYDGALRHFVTKLQNTASFKAALAAATETTEAAAGAASVSIPGLTEGIYVVIDTTAMPSTNPATGHSSSAPMLVGTTVGNGATAPQKTGGYSFAAQPLGVINMKNEKPGLTKESNATGAEGPGSILTYTLKQHVPNTAAATDYTLLIKDTPSTGLQWQGSSNVEIKATKKGAAEAVLSPSEYSIRIEGTPAPDPANPWTGDGTSQIIFDLSNAVKNQGLEFDSIITITYKMKVVDDGTGSWSNKARYTACSTVSSQEPQCYTTEATYPQGTPSAKTYKLELDNKSKADESLIAGAKYTMKDAAGNPVTFNLGANGEYVRAEGAAITAQSVTEMVVPRAAVTDPGADGILQITYLPKGTYTITQTAGPEGYSNTFKPEFTVTVDEVVDPSTSTVSTHGNWTNSGDAWGLVAANSTPTDIDGATAFYVVTVYSVNSITQLPMTGGAGVILAVIVAIVLLGAAGTLTFYKKKMQKQVVAAAI